jgi:nitrite reductase/ring-hydroxylating ferredoxin subunit
VNNDNIHTHRHFICEKHQLGHGDCLEFELNLQPETEPGAQKNAFVINWRGRFYAYRNQCPHTGITLNWAPNQFLDIQNRYVQCGLHGALFEPDSGLCIHGPCLAQSLASVPMIETELELFIDLDKIAHFLTK